jgi:hypothetical protein
MSSPEPPADIEALVRRLGTLRLPEAPSRGGPYVGIVHNDLTREIAAAGDAVVPLLLERLRASGFDESVFIVFLLRELRASEAVPVVKELQSHIDELSAGRDMTLKMQVKHFLDQVGG